MLRSTVRRVRVSNSYKFLGRREGFTHERDGPKVGEGDERGAFLEVLDDPFGVVLAEAAIGLFSEAVAHGFAG